MIPDFPIGPMPPFFYSYVNFDGNNFIDILPKVSPRIYHNFEKFNLPEEEIFVEGDKDIIDHDPINPYPGLYPPPIRQILFTDMINTDKNYQQFIVESNPDSNPIHPFLPSEFWYINEKDCFQKQVTEMKCDDFDLM